MNRILERVISTMGLWTVIKEYLQRLSLSKYRSELTKEINLMENVIANILTAKAEVSQSFSLIPRKYVLNLIKEQETIYLFNDTRELYSFNTKLLEVIKKIPQTKKPSSFKRFEESYKNLTGKYNESFKDLREEINRKNEELTPYYLGVKKYQDQLQKMKREYIGHSQMNQTLKDYEYIERFFRQEPDVNQQVKEFFETFMRLEELVKEWNLAFVTQELLEMKEYFNDIDGKSLDPQQREAIVIDEDANLIVAGAGSGKTLTISGKVKYLVEKKEIHPEEILLISFTRKAAEEMETRIKKRLRLNVEVNTFHKLGMRIISKYKKEKPNVVDNPKVIIKNYFDQEMYDDPQQLKRMIEYFGYYLNVPIDLENFDSLGEAYEYQKSMDLETLKSKYEEQKYTLYKTQQLKSRQTTLAGEKLKSLEEVMIANFLFLNGVEYVYERDYPHTMASENYRSYKPDFYLPQYDIYIEHFGITKDNRTPWLSEIEGKKYLDGIKWKREIHKEHRTILVETYSYLTGEGRLLETLRKKLLDEGVKYKEVDFIDIFNKIYDNENTNHYDEFIQFIASFINLFKSNGYEYETFDEIISNLDKKNIFFYNRTKTFLEITKSVYLYYQKQLATNKQIDFNDMINEATHIVGTSDMAFPYRYIIIDEYQDISVSRFKLVETIRNKTKAKVMAVGDDWQSIYRFAGSDLNLFTNFEKYFGYNQLLKIENTYRNSQELINYAGQFVMKNEKQIKKDLKSEKRNPTPIKMLGYVGVDEILRTLKYTIGEIVQDFGPKAEIMLLGRNNFDVNFLDKVPEFKVLFNQQGVKVTYQKYPKLNMFFLSTHRSKGLEADNVIIINASNRTTGFPNRMSDDPILSLVLTEQDEYLFAEERRLFYVALTRTKNSTYILVPDMNMSSFVRELKEYAGIEYKVLEGNTVFSNNPSCPRCKTGHLKLRDNNRSKREFLGCSNYPECDYALKDITILDSPIECAICGGYMVQRKGKRGRFYGCSNYPNCKHTMNLPLEKIKI